MPTGYFPIVYVRGYAATQGEIDEAVDDPFYGFNLGSSVYRADARSKPQRFFFESPLVRLMSDHKYRDTYENGQSSFDLPPEDASKRTLWIYRYYDESATTTDDPEHYRADMEVAATRLKDFIDRVRQATGAPLVHLVAHSMGGLICRSLIQKVYPESGEKASDHIARFFTYATPHGGIHFRKIAALLAKVRDFFGPFDSDVFGQQRMFAYLTPGAKYFAQPPKDFDCQSIPEATFPNDDIFCLVGTNAGDYDAALGWARRLVGPDSDGLVQIDRAFLRGAHQAHVHRSHSGRHGIVNSEAAYKHLESFLFGNIVFGASLVVNPKASRLGNFAWHLDVKISLWGSSGFAEQATQEHFCPVVISRETFEANGEEFKLAELFLSVEEGENLRFVLEIAVHAIPLSREHGNADFKRLAYGIPDWSMRYVTMVSGGKNAGLIAPRNLKEPAPLVMQRDPMESLPDEVSAFLESAKLRFTCNVRKERWAIDEETLPA